MKSEDIKQAIKNLFERELAEGLKKKLTEEDIPKFEFENRMALFAKQASSLQIGTHTSKGVNPLSKGDSILFDPSTVDTPSTLAGSHNIAYLEVDITGCNNYYVADVSIYSLLNLVLEDGSKFVDLLIAQDERLKTVFSDDVDTSLIRFEKISKIIVKDKGKFKADAYNKQLLFPLNADQGYVPNLGDFKYANLIPLYPSSLNKEVVTRLKEQREARDLAWQGISEEELTEGYFIINNVAVLAMGGTRPVNTSKLTQKTAGNNYLLCNLPRKPKKLTSFYLSKNSTTVFRTKSMRVMLRPSIENLVYSLTVYDAKYIARRNIEANLTQAISKVLDIALTLRANESGWLMKHKLNINEKFWLDPNRGELEGQGIYKDKRESVDWEKHIINDITKFLMAQVGFVAKYKKAHLNIELDSYLFKDWRVVVKDVIANYSQNKKEVL